MTWSTPGAFAVDVLCLCSTFQLCPVLKDVIGTNATHTESLLKSILVPPSVLQWLALSEGMQSMTDQRVKFRPKQTVNEEHLKAAEVCYDLSNVLQFCQETYQPANFISESQWTS